ncbi:MAG: hypothetical protein ACYCOU_24535, partial [Sulfobacillus sp.]
MSVAGDRYGPGVQEGTSRDSAAGVKHVKTVRNHPEHLGSVRHSSRIAPLTAGQTPFPGARDRVQSALVPLRRPTCRASRHGRRRPPVPCVPQDGLTPVRMGRERQEY